LTSSDNKLCQELSEAIKNVKMIEKRIVDNDQETRAA
jgi:hypothetical protein